MMNVQVICVGKLKETFYIQAIKEYEKRLAGCCKLQLLELPEERLPENPSPAQIQAALAKERDAVKGKIAKGATVVALCIEGKPMSSPQLQFLRNAPGSQGPGRLEAEYVPHDLPPPSGPGHAAGADLSRLQN
jgi:23S rRNA (pseudouridine1915-N3)-methyltransferase